MDIDAWLAAAVADAENRGLPELKPLLEAVANSTRALRKADWTDRADGGQRLRPARGAEPPSASARGWDAARSEECPPDTGLERNRP
jgi:hypothetical protein